MDIEPFPGMPEPNSDKPQKGGGKQCAGCGKRWGGLLAAHCAADRSATFALRDGDPQLRAQWDSHLHESPVHRGRVPAKLFADLLSAQAHHVQTSSLRPPLDSCVFESVLTGREWTKVRWSIVGLDVVDVVNVLSIGDPSVKDSVLVGFDVLVRADPPSESDIPMRRGVATRLFLWDTFTRAQLTDVSSVAGFPAVRAKAALRRPRYRDSTHSADGSGHDAILQVTALCHQTFISVEYFDRHTHRPQLKVV